LKIRITCLQIAGQLLKRLPAPIRWQPRVEPLRHTCPAPSAARCKGFADYNIPPRNRFVRIECFDLCHHRLQLLTPGLIQLIDDGVWEYSEVLRHQGLPCLDPVAELLMLESTLRVHAKDVRQIGFRRSCIAGGVRQQCNC
jgi:hypothetical protein